MTNCLKPFCPSLLSIFSVRAFCERLPWDWEEVVAERQKRGKSGEEEERRAEKRKLAVFVYGHFFTRPCHAYSYSILQRLLLLRVCSPQVYVL
jgi:hypothetical protein